MAPVSPTSSVIPEVQKAIVAAPDGTPRIKEDAPCPKLGPAQLLLRTEAVAINPSDTKMRGDFVTAGGILGADYAGTVIAKGEEVTGIEVGDRVAGAQYAMHAQMPDRGAFGEYNTTHGDVYVKVPDSWSIESAATLGAGISTAGLAIKALGLPLPDAPLDKPKKVLVWGGSTATGSLLIQLLKLANCIPIVTCSPNSRELVESRGAEAVFDYRDKDCAAKIRAYTGNSLAYAVDCITTIESTSACFAALGRAGGRYVSLDPPSDDVIATRKTVKTDWVLGPSIFGAGVTWPAPYRREPSSEVREFGVRLWKVGQKLIDEGKLQNHPVKVLGTGFESIVEGLDMVAKGQVRGEKIVVKLE